MTEKPIPTISAADHQRLLTAVAEAGGVEELLTRSAATTRARLSDRREYMFRHAGDVYDAVDRKLLTEPEARVLLGFPRTKKTASSRTKLTVTRQNQKLR